MLNYEEFNYGEKRVSADNDTVEMAIISGVVKPQAPSVSDLLGAIEWLATYQSGFEEDYEIEIAQSFANVIAFLDLTADSKLKRKAVNEAKRKYAKEHGLKVRQVRVQK